MKTKLYLLVISLMSIVNTNVYAVDAKTFPGAMCQPAEEHYNISRDYRGRMYNPSSYTQTWICPITRDTMASNYSDAVKNAWVNIVDLISAKDISCTFYSRGSRSTLIDYVTSTSAISANVIGFSNVGGSYGGLYYIRCMVPGRHNNGPMSGIISYRVDEK